MEINSVFSEILQYLRNGIITGEFASGQKLNESQLAMKFNISRPPLREAFRILEEEHMIVSAPRRGCYVSEISLEDLEQVYQARMMIEFYAFDILKEKNIKNFSQINEAFIAVSNLDLSRLPNADSKERLKYLRMLADFHTKLVESTQNHLLIHFHKTITYKLAQYQYLIPYSRDSFNRSQDHHRQIMEFIEVGAYDQAKDCLRTHLKTFVEILKNKLRGEASFE